MIHPPYWDNITFIFYLIIGLYCAIAIGIHFGTITINGVSAQYPNLKEKKWYGYLPLLIILILFACLRKVGPGIGGTDALSYEQDFLESLTNLKNFENTDILYGKYSLYLRHLTSSPFIFRLISYSFIAFSMCYFIKEICPKNISCIPFILLVWPYICGFSSMRSSMAIGFILLSLIALYKKQYAIEWLFIIIAVLFHRMMFFLVPVFIFFPFIYKLIVKCNRYQLLMLICGSIAIISLLAITIQKYVLLLGLLDKENSPDASYIAKSLDMNLLESWPMFIQQLFLLIFLFISFKKLNSRKERFVLVISCFDIVITIPALILGIYRISQILLIPTLMLWGLLIYNFYHKFRKNVRPLIGFVFLLGFCFIFYKRLESLYESSSLMPYMFFWE